MRGCEPPKIEKEYIFTSNLYQNGAGFCAEVKKTHNFRRYNEIYEGGV